MVMIKGGSFELPLDYMAYIPTKNERTSYFKAILDFYKTELPSFNLVYACLMPWEKVIGNIIKKYNDFSGKVDYILIFKVPNSNGESIYLIEAPLFATERSCVGFEYAKEKGLLDKYRNMVMETAARVTEDKFDEFIYLMAYTEIYEGFLSRNTSRELSIFYDNLPRSIKNLLANDVKPNTEEVILDSNAQELHGVLSLNPNFWTTPENRDAMAANTIILSTYYNRAGGR